MKIHRDFSIEAETYKNFLRIIGKGNVSSKINDYMDSYINTAMKDTSSINIEILNIEVETLKKESERVNLELQNKLTAIDNYNNKRLESEKALLEAEAKRIEAQSKCLQCKNIITTSKKYTFKLGNVCSSCFLNCTSEQVKAWGGE